MSQSEPTPESTSMDIFTWPYELRSGHSSNPAKGACALDAINWLVHGQHGDKPPCVSTVIAPYVIWGNDVLPHRTRQRLLPYLHRIAGSRSEAHEAARMSVLKLGGLRILAPLTLDAIGFFAYAEQLRNLPDKIRVRDAEKVTMAMRWNIRDFPDSVGGRVARETLHDAALTAAEWDWKSVGLFAARTASHARLWDGYFTLLGQVLNAGPQGEPWSADVVHHADQAFVAAGGRAFEFV